MKRYKKEEMISLIREYSSFLGRTPRMREISRNQNFPPINQFLKKFNTWNNLLRECGLKINAEGSYSKDILLQHLRNFQRQYSRPLRMKEFMGNAPELPSHSMYYKHFGSWNKALRLAGLKPPTLKKYTKKEILSSLKNKAKKIGKTPSQREIGIDKNCPSIPTIERHFGSWNNALKAANLEIKYLRRKWTKEDSLHWIRKKYQELGKSPSPEDFDKDVKSPGKNTIIKFFGSWTNALRESNVPIKKYHTKEDIIKILKRISRKINRTPTITDIRALGGPTSIVFSKKFGSYTAACLSAGLRPNTGKSKDIWKGWEDHCIDMANVLHKSIEIQTDKLIERGIPDIYIPERKLLIDAKTCGYKEFREQVKKYCKGGLKLEFWCIFKGMENRSKKVKYRYAEELAEIMKKNGRKDLASKCYQFIRNIYSEGQTTLN